MYSELNKKIINLLRTGTEEKKITWRLNKKNRFFSTAFSGEWIIRIIEDVVPPRLFRYKIIVVGQQFLYEIQDVNNQIEDLFQFILNDSEMRHETRTLEISLKEVISEIEKKVSR